MQGCFRVGIECRLALNYSCHVSVLCHYRYQHQETAGLPPSDLGCVGVVHGGYGCMDCRSRRHFEEYPHRSQRLPRFGVWHTVLWVHLSGTVYTRR